MIQGAIFSKPVRRSSDALSPLDWFKHRKGRLRILKRKTKRRKGRNGYSDMEPPEGDGGSS